MSKLHTEIEIKIDKLKKEKKKHKINLELNQEKVLKELTNENENLINKLNEKKVNYENLYVEKVKNDQKNDE